MDAVCNGKTVGGCGAHGNCSAPATCTCDKDVNGDVCWLGTDCTKPAFASVTKVAVQGNFTIVGTVGLSSTPCKYGAGNSAVVTMAGKTLKQITTGAVSYQVFESGIQHFVLNGASDYFKTGAHHASDPTLPLALTLADPSSTTGTDYTLSFNFTMPAKNSSGDFSVVFYGSDQDKYPYDFSVTIDYTF